MVCFLWRLPIKNDIYTWPQAAYLCQTSIPYEKNDLSASALGTIAVLRFIYFAIDVQILIITNLKGISFKGIKNENDKRFFSFNKDDNNICYIATNYVHLVLYCIHEAKGTFRLSAATMH